jgi:hypothetical protein
MISYHDWGAGFHNSLARKKKEKWGIFNTAFKVHSKAKFHLVVVKS